MKVWVIFSNSSSNYRPQNVVDQGVEILLQYFINEKNIIFHGSAQYTFFTFLLTIFQLFV